MGNASHDKAMGAFSRGLSYGSLVLALCALLVRAHDFWRFTVDDTFITLRYAKHLAQGLGPTWNPSAQPVEGYTTALWVLILAVPHALGLDALVFAKVVGIACAAAALTIAALFARELTRDLDPRARALATMAPFALSVAYWPLALHAISGMETSLAALLLTLFALVSVRYLRAPTRLRGRSLALLGLFAALTRPELALAAGVIVCAMTFAQERALRPALLRVIGVYAVLPGLVYFGARYAYFGLLLPLPFYVKATGQPPFAGLSDVGGFFAPFALAAPHLALLAVAGAAISRQLLPALLGLSAFALFYVFPAHVMGFEGRYLVPMFPCLTALIGAGVGTLAARAYRVRAGGERKGMELALAIATFALLSGFALPKGEGEARTRWVDYGDGLTRAHVAFGAALRKARPTVVRPSVALLDVGAVGYYSDWFVIDTFGLNDAHVGLTERLDPAYVLAQQPELLVLVSAESDRFVSVFDWERPLAAHARDHGYAPLCSYDFEPGYQLYVLARSGSLLSQSLDCPRVAASDPEAPRAAR